MPMYLFYTIDLYIIKSVNLLQCYTYLTNRCTIVFLLIINILHLKDRLLKILLVFCENQKFNFFFIVSFRTEGKEAKTAFSGPGRPRL